jgi:hypothetical protein
MAAATPAGDVRKREKRPGYGLCQADSRQWPNRWFAEQGLYSLQYGSCCSVPRFFRELFPIGFGVNREAEAGCCGVILSILAVEVFPPWGAGIFGG